MGNDPLAAPFPGICVARVRFTLLLTTGLMRGMVAVCLTSRPGCTRPSNTTGTEVVPMVVLRGAGIPGVVIAAVIMGMVTFGSGLLNVPGNVMSIFLGLSLIGVIALQRWFGWRGE